MRTSPTRLFPSGRPCLDSSWQLLVGLVACLALTETRLPAQNRRPTDQRGPDRSRTAANLEQIDSRIRVPSFKGVTPGRTTRNEALVLLGEPDGRTSSGNATKLSFHIEPFERIDVICTADMVTSVVIHLASITEADQLAGELQLDILRSAPVLDEQGSRLGEVYPERGILFAYAEGGMPRGVRQILLEKITAEPFVLRAKFDARRQYQDNIADLKYALKLDPQHAYALWLLAKIQHWIGDYPSALRTMRRALRLDETNPRFLLTKARIQDDLGHNDLALQLTRDVLDQDELPPELRARATCQLGDLLASGPAPDYKQAIQQHQQAIELAVEVAGESRMQSRRSAKRVLLDAHLGVARDIALGQWRRKTEVVPKWLNHAGAIAAELIQNEEADPALQLDVHRHALATFVQMDVRADPTKITEAAIRDATEIVADQGDRLYHGRVARAVGDCLFDAATLAYRRDDRASALTFAQQALEYLEDTNSTINSTRQHEYRLGCLYYLIGAIYANQDENHAEAVSWYAQARPLLERAIVPKTEQVKHAERFVSMGVSYWHAGSRKVGLELTNYGARALQQSVNNGLAGNKTLIVPYGNLASMYSQMGERSTARKFAQTAERLRAASDPVKQR